MTSLWQRGMLLEALASRSTGLLRAGQAIDNLNRHVVACAIGVKGVAAPLDDQPQNTPTGGAGMAAGMLGAGLWSHHLALCLVSQSQSRSRSLGPQEPRW